MINKNIMDYSLKYLTGSVKTGCSNMTLLYSANYLPWLTNKKVVWYTTKKNPGDTESFITSEYLRREESIEANTFLCNFERNELGL